MGNNNGFNTTVHQRHETPRHDCDMAICFTHNPRSLAAQIQKISAYEAWPIDDLMQKANTRGIQGVAAMDKMNLISALRNH